MLTIIVSVVGLLCLAIAIVTTCLYVPTVRAVRPAYRELLLAEGEAVEPAREKYWALDRRQRRLALWTIAVYALGLFSTIPLGESRQPVHLACVIGLTLCIWVVSWFATFRTDTWQIRMEVDELKHQKRLEVMRRQAASGK